MVFYLNDNFFLPYFFLTSPSQGLPTTLSDIGIFALERYFKSSLDQSPEHLLSLVMEIMWPFGDLTMITNLPTLKLLLRIIKKKN